MRIKGSGSGPGSGGLGGRRQRSDADAFRRGRRVGATVRGRFLSVYGGDLAWVEVDGHRLLARLDHASTPGQELVFRIECLSPEVVLKDITHADQGDRPFTGLDLQV